MITTNSISIIKNLLIVFLIFAGLYYAKKFLIPLSIGGVLATLFLPLCKGMEKKKVPKVLAALVCLLILLLFIASIGTLLGWQISELTGDIALIKQKIIETGDRMQQYIFKNYDISVERQTQIFQKNKPSVDGFIPIMAGSVTSVLADFILVMAYVVLLLFYRSHIKKFLLKLAPISQKKEMELVINSAAFVSQQYLIGLAKMIVCLWIMFSIGFTIAGVHHPFSFAILCGLLEIVPFIGNITGTTITVLVSAAEGAKLPMLAGIVFTYGVVQFIQGWFLEPLIVGPQVKINPFSTIIALVIGELVWGIPGIVLAIPLTAMLKIICDHIEPLKPYGFLIGELETVKRDVGFIEKRFKNKKHKE